MLFKNTASQRVRVFAFDATTGLPKTGDAANVTAYVAKDFGSVTQLTDTSATEEDSTNAKGYYWFDISQTETNADNIMVTGKSTTSNIVVVGAPAMIATRPPNAGALSIDASGRVDVIKINGTSQTARDVGASVLLSSGSGTGQLDFTSGVVKANVTQLLGTAWLTPGTAGTPDVNVKLWNGLATVALPLVPTVAGRTLDVSAGGEAGVDWANVGSPGTAVNLSGTTVNLVNTVTTLTNLPAITAGWLTATGIAASALNGKGDWLLASSYSAPPSAAAIRAEIDANSTGLAAIYTDTHTTLPAALAAVPGAVWSNVTRTLTSAGAGGATAQEVWEYASRTLTGFSFTPSVDVAQVHGVTLTGSGTAADPWRPA
jgi:hypothetical protein